MNKNQKNVLESNLQEARQDLLSVIADLAESNFGANAIPDLAKALEMLSHLEYYVKQTESDPEPQPPDEHVSWEKIKQDRDYDMAYKGCGSLTCKCRTNETR